MAEQWLSIVEYARTFQVSDMTVRRRIRTGRLHAVLKEGKYFIPIAGNDARAGAQLAPSVAEVPRAQATAAQRPSFSEPRRVSGGEMHVIKAHPAPHRTLQPAAMNPHAFEARRDARPAAAMPAPVEADDAPFTDFDETETGFIPASLRRSVQTSETTLVDSRALLAFCEATMKKVNEAERRQVERFKSKLETLEATVANRDLEIKQLNQQLEDLKLLVRVMESKRSI